MTPQEPAPTASGQASSAGQCPDGSPRLGRGRPYWLVGLDTSLALADVKPGASPPTLSLFVTDESPGATSQAERIDVALGESFTLQKVTFTVTAVDSAGGCLASDPKTQLS